MRNTFSNAVRDLEYQVMVEKIYMKEYLIINEDKEILDVPLSQIHPSSIINYKEKKDGTFHIYVNNDWSV
jgi:hypothetical protein